MEWNQPKIIIGKEAGGEYYYRRPGLEEKMTEQIIKGNNLLLKAPRRVGKTSVLKYLEENPFDGFKLIFRNVQGVQNEIEFYRILYVLILKCLSRFKTNKTIIANYLKQKKIAEISWTGGIKIEDQEINYLQEINQLIPKLKFNGETVVLLIDELPEVLHNLYKNGKSNEAKSILKNIRNWGQQTGYEKLQFVFAGSVGIHYVTNLITGRSSDINNLYVIEYPPLEKDDIKNYIDWVTVDATIKYNDHSKNHMLEKVQYFVPYFINLMLEEIDSQARKLETTEISSSLINEAFNNIVKVNKNFEDWKKRLSDYLPNENYRFVNDILIHIAHKDQISIQEIYDKAVAHDKVADFMYFVGELEEAGYLVEKDKFYFFISPFLKAYWKRNNPIYNG